jgi:hypothetical protein
VRWIQVHRETDSIFSEVATKMCDTETPQMPIEYIIEMPSKTTVVQSTDEMFQQAGTYFGIVVW